MKKIPLLFYIRGGLLFVVYLVLSVYFLFLSPHKVPTKEALSTVSISSDSLFCMIPQNPNESYLGGNCDGVEMRSIALGKKRGLNLLGSNEYFIQVREKPDRYKLLIDENSHTLFGKRYIIYQIEANDKVLLNYDESAGKEQSELNLFFYISIAFFAFMGFVLIKTIQVNYRKKGTGRNW